MLQQAMKLSDGNPGAAMFIMELLNFDSPMLQLRVLKTLEDIKTLRGTNLCVLYSDLAGKDLRKVEEICEKVPLNVLEDACSRQDYSGIALIKPYLDK